MRVPVSPLRFSPASGLRRPMPRAPHQREPTYEQDYDFDTVAYDCFRATDRRYVVIIAAPLWDFRPVVLQTIANGFGVPAARVASRRLKLHEQIRVRTDRAVAG